MDRSARQALVSLGDPCRTLCTTPVTAAGGYGRSKDRRLWQEQGQRFRHVCAAGGIGAAQKKGQGPGRAEGSNNYKDNHWQGDGGKN